MLLWLNGPFGGGKTTTARHLLELVPEAVLFDPEHVGTLLHRALGPVERVPAVSDFQQYAGWRRLVPVVAAEVYAATGGPLIAVQTVLREDYWLELAAGLDRVGLEHRMVALDVSAEEHARRIDADTVETTAVAWRHRHRTAWEDALAWLPAYADLLDTTELTPEQAVEAVAARWGW